MSDYDSPWKEALDRFLAAFLEFFFPAVYAAVDWSRGYESLDKELQQIVREGELGRRLADMLFKVWRRDGVARIGHVREPHQDVRVEQVGH